MLGDLSPIAGTGEKVTLSGAAAVLTTAMSNSLNAACTHLMIQCDDAAIRYTFDGTDPVGGAGSGGKGYKLAADDVMIIPRSLAETCEIIKDGATTAYIWIEQFTYGT